ncbi:MAG TPA: DUF6158 family protein [Actinomycetales bacterium]|nr:DUF6158 family protein [Actinomycetales bacterium]
MTDTHHTQGENAPAEGTNAQAEQTGPAPHPTKELSDDELFTELAQLYETRLETLRHGSDAALENSDRRIDELEREYLHRHPHRDVSARRLRPDDTSLTPPRH